MASEFESTGQALAFLQNEADSRYVGDQKPTLENLADFAASILQDRGGLVAYKSVRTDRLRGLHIFRGTESVRVNDEYVALRPTRIYDLSSKGGLVQDSIDLIRTKNPGNGYLLSEADAVIASFSDRWWGGMSSTMLPDLNAHHLDAISRLLTDIHDANEPIDTSLEHHRFASELPRFVDGSYSDGIGDMVFNIHAVDTLPLMSELSGFEPIR